MEKIEQRQMATENNEIQAGQIRAVKVRVTERNFRV